LCEKPLATNLNDVEAIIEGCKNVKTSCMIQRRFYPGSIAIKEVIENKYFGEIKKASIDFKCNKKSKRFHWANADHKYNKNLIDEAKKTIPKLREEIEKELKKQGLHEEMIKLLFKDIFVSCTL